MHNVPVCKSLNLILCVCGFLDKNIDIYMFDMSHVDFIFLKISIADCSINVHENSCKEQSPMCDKNRNSIRVNRTCFIKSSFLFVLAYDNKHCARHERFKGL